MALVHTFPYKRSYPAKWNGILRRQRGTVHDHLFSISDWFPTLADAAGLELPDLDARTKLDEEVNGVSQVKSLFRGQRADRTRLLHTVHACPTETNACGAMRWGEWKLAVGRWTNQFDHAAWIPVDEDLGLGYTGPSMGAEIECGPPPAEYDRELCRRDFCLFNITEDPCEYNDLSAQYPEVVEQLRVRLDVHLSRTVPTLADEPSEGCEAV